MRLYIITAILSTLVIANGVDKSYNILTLDGGGIKGIIPAVVLQKLETYAGTYIKGKPYESKVPKYPGREGVVAMKDMFHMMAGTSTGSIISAALTVPKLG